jgi:hypothetical protein
MRIGAILVLLSLLFMAALGKDNKERERVYDAPFDKVWTACVQAANEKYTVKLAQKADGVISFEQGGSLRSNSYGTIVGVTVVAVSDNATKVTINPQNKQAQLFARAGADITKKFLAAVEEKLKVTAP